MIYKIGNIADLNHLPTMDDGLKQHIEHLAKSLSALYGEERNVDEDDGGYILYVEPGTALNELRKAFDYTRYTIEYVTYDSTSCPPIISAHYIVTNEYVVTLIMSADDAPQEILNEL